MKAAVAYARMAVYWASKAAFAGTKSAAYIDSGDEDNAVWWARSAYRDYEILQERLRWVDEALGTDAPDWRGNPQ